MEAVAPYGERSGVRSGPVGELLGADREPRQDSSSLDAPRHHRAMSDGVRAELGETSDPRRLVPGDPAAVAGTATALRARAAALAEAGAGLERIGTVDGWSGPAGDAFRAKFRGQPGNWRQA